MYVYVCAKELLLAPIQVITISKMPNKITIHNNITTWPNLPGPGLVSTSPESRSNMDTMLVLKYKTLVVVLHSKPSEYGEITVCTRKLVLAKNF
jgi:hypothetical protein